MQSTSGQVHRMRSERVGPEQPQSATVYIVLTVIMACILVVMGWFLTDKIDSLTQSNAERAFFVLLLFLALFAALFLFGIVKSFATIRGKRLGTTFEFGGPAAVFIVVIILGMRLLPSDSTPDQYLNLYLQAPPNFAYKDINSAVQVYVELRVGGRVLAEFNDGGQATIWNVPQSILALHKVDIDFHSQTFGLKDNERTFNINDHAVYIPIRPLKPSEGATGEQWAACRNPAHGLERFDTDQVETQISNFMGGGFDQTKWCSQVIANLRTRFPDAEFKIQNSSEHTKNSCAPFNCPQYQYSCSVEVRVHPIYKLARSPECGPA